MLVEKIRKKLESGILTAGLVSILSMGVFGYNLRAEEQKSKQTEQTENLYPGGGSIAPCLPALGCDPTKPIAGAIILPKTEYIEIWRIPNHYCLPPLICGEKQNRRQHFRGFPPDNDSEYSTGVRRIALEKIRPQYLILKEIKRI